VILQIPLTDFLHMNFASYCGAILELVRWNTKTFKVMPKLGDDFDWVIVTKY